MTIKSSKWKNIITLTSLFFLFVILFDIVPKYYDLISSGVVLLFNGNVEEQLNNTSNKLSSLEIENKKLKVNINSMASNYEADKKVSAIISLIDISAKKSNAQISEIIPGISQRKDNLFLQPVKVNLTSDYESLFNFIRQLENSNKVLVLKSISIKQSKESNKILIAEANIDAYMKL